MTTKPKGIRNIDGGSVGGPIKKEQAVLLHGLGRHVRARGPLRALFRPGERFPHRRFQQKAGSADHRTRSGNPIMVPTTEGGITQLRQGMVFDPFTGNLDGTGRSVFSSNGRLNVIPTSRLNPAMMKLLALVPNPNQAGDVNNYFNSGTQRLNRNNFDAKVNWNRNDETPALVQVQRHGRAGSWRLRPGPGRWRMFVRRRRRRRPHPRADGGHRAHLYRLAQLPD